MSEPLRIAYDARMSLGRYRGMGAYLRRLIAGREPELLGLCATGEEDSSLRLAASGARPYPLWEQISLPRLLRSHRIDVFVAPYNTAPLRLPKGTTLVLVVHDLIFMEPLPWSPSLYQNAGRWYRRIVTPRAVQRADRIVTVSDYTAGQLVSRFGLERARIRVIPNSLERIWYRAEPASEAAEPYVFMVSGEAPSKNLARALEAFALLRQRGGAHSLRLKIAGVKPSHHAAFMKAARELRIADRVDFLPYLTGEDMRRLYRQAAVLFMPSLSEGFGIPVLEAMASGVPVAASNTTSLPEIAGEAALYFDPVFSQQMADALHRIVRDCALRNFMSEQGRFRALRFHPDVVGGKIQSFWDELEHQL